MIEDVTKTVKNIAPSTGQILLHDAELVAVQVDRINATMLLDFRLEDLTHCKIQLLKVRAFRCEDMILQNVVSRILQSTEGDFARADLDYWVNWVTSLSDASSWLSTERKKVWDSEFADRKINLFVLEPSAGATLAAICEEITRI